MANIDFRTPKQILDEGAVPMLGADREINSGLALCHAVATGAQTKASILCFGMPGSGKSAYGKELPYRINKYHDNTKKSSPFHSVTVHATGLMSEGSDDHIRKSLQRLCKEKVEPNLPVVLIVDEFDALAPSRRINPDRQSLVQVMMGFQDALPDRTVSLWVTNYPDNADRAVVDRVRNSLYFDFPTAEVAALVLESLSVENAAEVASMLFEDAAQQSSTYSIRNLVVAIQQLRKIDPLIFDRPPEEVWEEIAAGCRTTLLRDIDDYRVDYAALILQSDRFLRRWTKLYEALPTS